MPHVLPVGIYLGFKGWMYWLWLVHVSPHVSALTTCSILAATLPVWATYLRCWLGDPGVISAPRQDKLEGVRSMFEGKRSVGCNILLHNIQKKPPLQLSFRSQYFTWQKATNAFQKSDMPSSKIGKACPAIL